MQLKMKPMCKKILSLSLAFMVAAGTFVFAPNQQAQALTSNKLTELQNKIDGMEKENAAFDQKIKALNGDLNAAEQKEEQLQKSVENKQQQIVLYAQKIDAAATEISDNQAAMRAKQKEIAKNKKLFSQRVRAMYMTSQTSMLELLFSSESFSDFLTYAEVLKRVSKHDNELITSLRAEKKELAQLQAALDEQKTALEVTQKKYESKVKTLNALIDQTQQSQAVITQKKAKIKKAKSDNDAQIVAAEKASDQEIERLRVELEKKRKAEAERRRLEELKRQQEAEKNGGGSTQPATDYPIATSGYMWPVPSTNSISSYFGWRSFGGGQNHRGIDIPAGGGSPILAANTGTVIIAQYGHYSYGNYIAVDHGNGVVTLYAHCNSLLKSVGQTVTRGTQIATVGTTGNSTGNHCHFEVQVHGQLQNPLNYVKRPY